MKKLLVIGLAVVLGIGLIGYAVADPRPGGGWGMMGGGHNGFRLDNARIDEAGTLGRTRLDAPRPRSWTRVQPMRAAPGETGR